MSSNLAEPINESTAVGVSRVSLFPEVSELTAGLTVC